MSQTIHGWLKAIPEPASIRVDGEHIVKLSKSPRRFTTAEDTIRSLGWTRLEALDAKGSILRAMNHPDDQPPEVTQGSALAGDLQAMSKMLSNAYTQGAEQHAGAYRTAFEFMCKLVDAQSKFLVMQTRVLQRQLQDQADELADAQDAAEAAGGGIVGTITQLAPVLDAMNKKPAGAK